jgi:hypothetical protein
MKTSLGTRRQKRSKNVVTKTGSAMSAVRAANSSPTCVAAISWRSRCSS